MSIFIVEVTYPNGNVEEIEEEFTSLEAAKRFGDNLMVQVGYNAGIKGSRFGRSVESFYRVLEKNRDETKIVYESNRQFLIAKLTPFKRVFQLGGVFLQQNNHY